MMEANAFLESAAAQGWRLCPEEATEAMVIAGINDSGDKDNCTGGPDDAFQLIWKAMVKAAPEFQMKGPGDGR